MLLEEERAQQHELVKNVHYPGLTSHPQHHVAQRQMHKGYGGVLSVEFHSEAIAMAVAGALQTPGWGVRKPCWSIGPALHLSVESQV